MEIKEFINGIWISFLFTFTFSTIAMAIHAMIFAEGVVRVEDIIAIAFISVLISLAGIVLCSSRGLKRSELLFRHIIRLFMIIGIVLSTATYMEWISWNAPMSVAVIVGIVLGIYIIAIAIEFYQSKKLMDTMNIKLKERNK